MPGRPVLKPVISKGAEDTSNPRPEPSRYGPSLALQPVAAEALPIRVAATAGAPASVRVDTFDDAAARRLGGIGLAIRLTRADGHTGAGHAMVTIDYSSFRDAFGGGFASRLRLVALPVCLLDATLTAACKQQATRDGHEVTATNDVPTGTLTADLDAAPARGSATAPSSAADDDVPAGSRSVYVVA